MARCEHRARLHVKGRLVERGRSSQAARKQERGSRQRKQGAGSQGRHSRVGTCGKEAIDNKEWPVGWLLVVAGSGLGSGGRRKVWRVAGDGRELAAVDRRQAAGLRRAAGSRHSSGGPGSCAENVFVAAASFSICSVSQRLWAVLPCSSFWATVSGSSGLRSTVGSSGSLPHSPAPFRIFGVTI